jgi:anti-sigma-K factor RskA
LVAEQLEDHPASEAPPIDPDAVQRAYRFHRARRRARIERRRRTRWAGVRFWLVVVALLAVVTLLAVGLSREIEHLFGF